MESWKEELYSTSYGDDLAHYGIEGMKWEFVGIRRLTITTGINKPNEPVNNLRRI